MSKIWDAILAFIRTGYELTTGVATCCHRSHRLGLPCLRGFTYDGFCRHHVDRCYHGCD